MTTVLVFRAGVLRYAVDVDAVRGVRRSTGLEAIPSLPDIAGVLPGDPPLTVLSPFGDAHGPVVVCEAGGSTFGVLADEVHGLVDLPAEAVTPVGRDAPGLIGGVAQDADGVVLVANLGSLPHHLESRP
jgi:chemotaxis signal transduction protein